jgi:undecaprenyl pyrophosphate phosphatase UppP
MSLPHIAILAIVQGLAELLPVSSSAHVWRTTFFDSRIAFKAFAWQVILATALTGVIGEGISSCSK